MPGLWADGWFYIASAGLLVSGALFFFLLGQFRAAADAADSADHEAPAETQASPVSPVFVGESPAPAAKLASAADKAEDKTPKLAASAPEARNEPTPTAPEKRRDAATTTGGISPAVVYLQNIKLQLDELHGEMRDLTVRLDSITGRDEALIERLGELAQAVAELKSAAPAPVESPAPKRVKKIEPPAPAPAPEPAPATPVTTQLEPAPEPKPKPESNPAPKAETTVELRPEPKAEAKRPLSAEETVRMELGAAIDASLAPKAEQAPAAEAAAAPAPASAPAPAAEKPSSPPAAEFEPAEKPRRGPVWPV